MKNLLLILLLVLTGSVSFAQDAKSEKSAKEMMNGDNAAKMMEMMSKMMNVETRSSYSFPVSMKMEITNYENGAMKETNNVEYHVNPEQQTLAFSGKDKRDKAQDMTAVFDAKNGVMVMIMEKDKSYMAMNTKAMEEMGMDKMMKEHGANVNCSKTGKTKTIKGYPCEEYVCIDEGNNTKTEAWLTNKVKVDFAKASDKSPWGKYIHGLDGTSGMVMSGNFYKNNQLQGAMEVTEVNEQSKYSVDMSKYTKKDMFNQR